VTATVRRLRSVHWEEPPVLPDVVDWADVRALAVLARSVEGDDDSLLGDAPLAYILDAVSTHQHSARAASEIARALRDVSGSIHGRDNVERHVPVCTCGARGMLDYVHDAYYCPVGGCWLEPGCSDPECEFCVPRAALPNAETPRHP